MDNKDLRPHYLKQDYKEWSFERWVEEMKKASHYSATLNPWEKDEAAEKLADGWFRWAAWNCSDYARVEIEQLKNQNES